MRSCDIIIPVYNAFDCLKSCIESVLSYTDLQANRLIILDDKSSDERIIPLINEIISHRKQNIVFIKNKENQGFIKTVNIGMKYSSNDVVLLNSDTEVTEHWLDKIQRCAYSKEEIATVTPLSNNATIVSVPLYNNVNTIPVGYDLRKFQDLIDSVSYKEYPEIPTGVGFCFFINRNALDAVGFFDEESFGKGYAEEEDFCYRCLDYGFRHVLCDDAVVYHKGSQSMLDLFQEIDDSRQKILLEKYPYYKANTYQWFLNHPLKYINLNINFNLCLNNGKKNILILIHSWDIDINKNNLIGGTSIHVLDIIKKLRCEFNFHILAPYNDAYCLYSYWETGEDKLELYSMPSKCYTSSFFNLRYAKILEELIVTFNISIIHIHHMLGHYFDIIDIIKSRKLPLILSLHDFFSVCPRINKINHINKYCGFPNESECSFCLESYVNEYFNIENKVNIIAWKRIWSSMFSLADKIIIPSKNVQNEINSECSNLPIYVIEHGINIERTKEEPNIDADEKFNIAFLGNITTIKGKEKIEELVSYAHAYSDNIYFHLFGNMDSSLEEHGRFIYHGSYCREDIGRLFKENRIKLVCIFSIWPETYCYTLTESVASNIPVLAIDYGAVGQRIKENNLGWLLSNDTGIPEMYQVIKNIFKNKDKYKIVLKSVLDYKIKDINEMCHEYGSIYSAYKDSNASPSHDIERLKIFIKKNYFCNSTISLKIDQQKKYTAFLNSQHANEIEQIYMSYSWRAGKMVTWFPRKIKRLFKCYSDNGFKYTVKLIVTKKIINKMPVGYEQFAKCSLASDIQIYDVVVKRSIFYKFVFKCGNIDPQIIFTLNAPIVQPDEGLFILLQYSNTLAGYFKVYYDYGIGFAEENSTGDIYIGAASRIAKIFIPIKDWPYGLQLFSLRIDPPDNTVFSLKKIRFFKKKTVCL